MGTVPSQGRSLQSKAAALSRKVEKLTVYLDPELSPACGDSGELPAGGGTPGKAASVSGQLVWPFEGDVRSNGFDGIPAPVSEDVSVVAYVFRLSRKPTDRLSAGTRFRPKGLPPGQRHLFERRPSSGRPLL